MCYSDLQAMCPCESLQPECPLAPEDTKISPGPAPYRYRPEPPATLVHRFRREHRQGGSTVRPELLGEECQATGSRGHRRLHPLARRILEKIVEDGRWQTATPRRQHGRIQDAYEQRPQLAGLARPLRGRSLQTKLARSAQGKPQVRRRKERTCPYPR